MTKQQLIEQFKLDFPTLTKQSNDEVITLDQDEYEATIDAWADAQLLKLAKQAEAEAKAQAKADLLERLGITEDEAKLLLA
jgi:regulator of protease activity HflC (stomatin/prohibitin superfamily)